MATILAINLVALIITLIFVSVIFVLYLKECARLEKKVVFYQKKVDYYIAVLRVKAGIEEEGFSMGDKYE